MACAGERSNASYEIEGVCHAELGRSRTCTLTAHRQLEARRKNGGCHPIMPWSSARLRDPFLLWPAHGSRAVVSVWTEARRGCANRMRQIRWVQCVSKRVLAGPIDIRSTLIRVLRTGLSGLCLPLAITSSLGLGVVCRTTSTHKRIEKGGVFKIAANV
ncbi:hypothetical protein IE81DRAFT_241592 [Ceraceosorus guamensis]|uniref:Uncharacterized protein n=1 Tax=Ceraceosorus guamensis TaxID=1522189 RepID=A0A316W4K5_9BASI|nr:hypothetical protein IE81DRAFT_241592 [Ceraceosorus guamensis]PWN44877.1 hypothetical protein IE81DRAFT_241592 [Ceraceosorus guamensis]